MLADFNPVRAKDIYKKSSPKEIGEALLAKTFYLKGDDA
jgi:hypothetical protein